MPRQYESSSFLKPAKKRDGIGGGVEAGVEADVHVYSHSCCGMLLFLNRRKVEMLSHTLTITFFHVHFENVTPLTGPPTVVWVEPSSLMLKLTAEEVA